MRPGYFKFGNFTGKRVRVGVTSSLSFSCGGVIMITCD